MIRHTTLRLPNTMSQRCVRTLSSKESIVMPTPLSLGHGLQYHKSDKGGSDRPLAVVTGWMGAKANQMKPYLHFYHKHGIDTISHAVGPAHVLFPERAAEHMDRVLSYAMNPESTSPPPAPRDLIFHSFSVGGFLFGTGLKLMSQNPTKYANLPKSIKVQVFDSPPDYHSIATGLSKSMGLGVLTEKIVEHAAAAYLKATADTSGVIHRETSEIFHNNHIAAPSLWFYSKADPVSRWEDCETVIEKWRKRGTHVDSCTWENTPHIQHGRHDPEKYFGTLKSFLVERNLIRD